MDEIFFRKMNRKLCGKFNLIRFIILKYNKLILITFRIMIKYISLYWGTNSI